MLELTWEIRFKDEDTDDRGDIKISSLMYHFQEIAAAHAGKLGAGFDDLMENGLIWVMTKLKFSIFCRMYKDTAYVLSTYPRKKKGVTFFRDYYICDFNGNIMAAAESHWCIINFNTRKIERTDIDFDGEYTAREAFEEGIEKITIPELDEVGKYVVKEADLDRNQHTNNCRYGDIISDVAGGNNCSRFIINFVHEARLGDMIYLYRGFSGDKTVTVGKLDDGTPVFRSCAVYKQK